MGIIHLQYLGIYFNVYEIYTFSGVLVFVLLYELLYTYVIWLELNTKYLFFLYFLSFCLFFVWFCNFQVFIFYTSYIFQVWKCLFINFKWWCIWVKNFAYLFPLKTCLPSLNNSVLLTFFYQQYFQIFFLKFMSL